VTVLRGMRSGSRGRQCSEADRVGMDGTVGTPPLLLGRLAPDARKSLSSARGFQEQAKSRSTTSSKDRPYPGIGPLC
jgi:hypothetical protein